MLFRSKINTTSIRGGKVGWNLGADLRFGNYLFIQPGVHYYASSLSQEASDPSIDGFRNSLRLQSLKVPVVVGLSPFNLNRSDFAILVSSDRKSTRLNSSHVATSYAVFFLIY